ncbi:MAG: hypothetical protein Q9214_004723 [Letrouitia sp. 1 TL-2023]
MTISSEKRVRNPQLVARDGSFLATSELPPGLGKRGEIAALWKRLLHLEARDMEKRSFLATSELPPGVGKRDETAALWKRLLHLEARDMVSAQPIPTIMKRDLIPETKSTDPVTRRGLFGRGVGPETTQPPVPTARKRDIFETVTLTVKKQ